MNQAATSPSPVPGGGNAGLGDAAMRGGGWATMQSLVGKAVAVAASFVLAWFLTEADFGTYGLASTIGGFLLPFVPTVMSDVLVNARTRASALAPAAARILLATTLLSALLLGALAWPIERYWGREGLAVVVAVVALRPVCGIPGTLALSRLRIALRYRDIAVGGIAITATNAIASVALALAGAGPLALALPLVLTQLVGAAIYSARAAGLDPTPPAPATEGERSALRRDYLVGNAGQYCHVAATSVDMLMLGLAVSTAALGRYYFAANLAMQSNLLFAYSIGLALQPIFAHLADDRPRQVAAFRRAAQALAVIAMPLCVLQAALVMPLLRGVFSEEWIDTAPLLVAMSIGQAFMFLLGPLTAIFRAQGRFGAYLAWQAAHGVAAAGAVGTCIALSDGDATVEHAAWAIAGVQVASVCAGLLLAFRGSGSALASALDVVARPAACAAASGGLVWLAATQLEPWWSSSRMAAIAMLLGGGVLGVAVHAALVRVFMPAAWSAFAAKIAARLGRARA